MKGVGGRVGGMFGNGIRNSDTTRAGRVVFRDFHDPWAPRCSYGASVAQFPEILSRCERCRDANYFRDAELFFANESHIDLTNPFLTKKYNRYFFDISRPLGARSVG